MTKKIVMIIAFENFRDEELFIPMKIFQSKGYEVKVASTKKGEAKGKLGGSVKVDMLYSEINVDDFDAVVFVGGPGCRIYFDDKTAHRICREAAEKKKVLGAICSSVATLAKAGVLKNKKATSFITEAEILKQNGALFSGKEVEADDRIISANGPGAAKRFGEMIADYLS